MQTATVAQFVHDTHKPEGKMPNRSIGLKAALSIAQRVDWQKMEQIADAAREYLPMVLAELESLRAAHQHQPARMARRAILFGIATPNRDEAVSIAWALSADRWYGILSPHALAYRTFATDTNPRAVLGMFDAMTTTLAYLQRIGIDRPHWTLSELGAIPGVGPKVARMIMAVLDPSAVSWTVDLWHQRQLLWAAGEPYAVRSVLPRPGYKVFEAVWLEYAERYFPGVDTFAVQWATWCAADGKFCSHAALWQDLAPSC